LRAEPLLPRIDERDFTEQAQTSVLAPHRIERRHHSATVRLPYTSPGPRVRSKNRSPHAGGSAGAEAEGQSEATGNARSVIGKLQRIRRSSCDQHHTPIAKCWGWCAQLSIKMSGRCDAGVIGPGGRWWRWRPWWPWRRRLRLGEMSGIDC
jgi:hypothetical protein